MPSGFFVKQCILTSAWNAVSSHFIDNSCIGIALGINMFTLGLNLRAVIAASRSASDKLSDSMNL